MNKRNRGGWLLCGVLGLFAGGCPCETSTAAEKTNIGAKVAGFQLDDYRGKSHSFSEFKKAKFVVVAFLGTECPLVTLYAPRLRELAESYADRGVMFVGVNANQQDSMTEIADWDRKFTLGFPILKDPANKVADSFGAERTPEVFVLDRNRVVRYRGRIDDQYLVGVQKPEADREDLKVALDELLAGKDVSEPTTKALGCLIGRVKRADPSGEVTYNNQIARLLNKRCVECHHEGQIAPFSLTTYDEVVGWAEMMQEVVHERRMPPWLAAPEHGSFKNDPSLTPDEIALIDQWIAGGCPEGNKSDAPDPVQYAEGWGISKPDQVFYMDDKPFDVPAEGVVDYQMYEVDPGFTEDMWIEEAEVKCSAPGVVHHVIVFIQQPGGMKFGAPQMAYAPGMTPRRFEKGMAIRAPAGCRLAFQVHYTPNGTAQPDRSYVGFKYADPATVTHEVMGGFCGDLALKIPPGEANHKIVADRKFLKETVLLGMNPHMHVRGKSFRYEIDLPDGTHKVLLDVPRYDFNWQLWYMLQEPLVIPKGSVMTCTAVFDNSEDNPGNPDPKKTVTWGEQTWDEMMFGFYSTIKPLKEKETADVKPASSRSEEVLTASTRVNVAAPLERLGLARPQVNAGR